MKHLISIVGPTASGKTSLSIEIAKKYSCHILSADSRQVYRQMDIGTAKPSKEEIQVIPHHFLDILDPSSSTSAGKFGEAARELMEELFLKFPVIVIAGGSGLYLKAVWEGFDEIPPVPLTVRNGIIREFKKSGIGPLQDELRAADPDTFSVMDIANPQRVIRALEVLRHTGVPVSVYRKGKKAPVEFENLKIGLTCERTELYRRINSRVDHMIDLGLLNEAKSLFAKYGRECKALQSVGYQEWLPHFDGEISEEEAIELIKRNSRRFAKRQLTWFRRDPEILWFDSMKADDVIHYIVEKLGSPLNL